MKMFVSWIFQVSPDLQENRVARLQEAVVCPELQAIQERRAKKDDLEIQGSRCPARQGVKEVLVLPVHRGLLDLKVFPPPQTTALRERLGFLDPWEIGVSQESRVRKVSSPVRESSEIVPPCDSGLLLVFQVRRGTPV